MSESTNANTSEGIDLCFVQDFTSRHQLNILILKGILSTLFIASGFVCNIAVLIMVHRKGCGSQLRLSFQVGALWETLLMLSCLYTHSFVTLYYKSYPLHGGVAYGYMLFHPLTNFFKTALVWSLTIVWTTRYIAIGYPMWYRQWYVPKKVRNALILAVLIAAVWNVTRGFELRVHWKKCAMLTGINSPLAKPAALPDNAGGSNSSIVFSVQWMPYAKSTWLRENRDYYLINYVVFSFAFLSVGPCLLHLLITIHLFWLLHSGIQTLKKLQSNDGGGSSSAAAGRNDEFSERRTCNNKMAKIAMLHQIKFLLCFMPSAITNLCELDENHCGMSPASGDTDTFYTFVACSETMILTSSSWTALIFFSNSHSVSLLKKHSRLERRSILKAMTSSTKGPEGEQHEFTSFIRKGTRKLLGVKQNKKTTAVAPIDSNTDTESNSDQFEDCNED